MATGHGNNSIVINGDTIHATLAGAFNELGAQEVAKRTRELVCTFNLRPFTMLINLLQLEGATPEAFSVSNEFNAWLNNQNMVAKAIVITSETIKTIDQKFVPSKQTQNVAYFDNEQDAMQWLTEQLLAHQP